MHGFQVCSHSNYLTKVYLKIQDNIIKVETDYLISPPPMSSTTDRKENLNLIGLSK